jgi:hypothetical protein
MNTLKALVKAVHQANALHAGFAYAWLTVIMVADTRSLTGGAGCGIVHRRFVQQVIL